MMRHKHLSSCPSYLLDTRSRILTPDLSLEYIQGLVDGSLLAYTSSSLCPQCRLALQELNDKVDALSDFLNGSLGG